MIYRIHPPQPPTRFAPQVALPSSKSISNRALVLNALSGGSEEQLANISDCDDTTVMQQALSLLRRERQEPHNTALSDTIDIKAAGTSMRFLTALLSVTPTPRAHLITGTERMRHRPIGILVDALRQLGAQIEYVGEEGFPPLRIEGKALTGGTLELPGNVSSQYISALLMVAPLMCNGLQLRLVGNIISRPYINMTVKMMRHLGAQVRWRGTHTLVVAHQPYLLKPFYVEADWSAASYWYEMALLNGHGRTEVQLTGLTKHSLQGDSIVRQLFDHLGIRSTAVAKADGNVPVMALTKQKFRLRQLDIDFTKMPDLAQTLVVACAMKDIPFHFTGLQSLRIKETDRIAALKTELAKMGVFIESRGDDTLLWEGAKRQRGGSEAYLQASTGTVIDTYDDHRMAMAFAPAAMVLGHIDIRDPHVVSKSYPHFWDDLRRAGFTIDEIDEK